MPKISAAYLPFNYCYNCVKFFIVKELYFFLYIMYQVVYKPYCEGSVSTHIRLYNTYRYQAGSLNTLFAWARRPRSNCTVEFITVRLGFLRGGFIDKVRKKLYLNCNNDNNIIQVIPLIMIFLGLHGINVKVTQYEIWTWEFQNVLHIVSHPLPLPFLH